MCIRDRDKLADISHKPVAVYAVTDRNLAKLCFDRLSDCGAIKNEEDMSCLLYTSRCV